jgi:hypothetical protein
VVLHLALEAVHLGDVAVHAEVVRGLAGCVDDRGDGQVGEVAAAVTAAVDQQAVPRALPFQLRPQCLVDDLRRDPVRQDRLVVADHLRLRVAGDALEGRVGVEDVRVGVGDRDGERRLLDHLAEHLRWDGRVGGLFTGRLGRVGDGRLAHCDINIRM